MGWPEPLGHNVIAERTHCAGALRANRRANIDDSLSARTLFEIIENRITYVQSRLASLANVRVDVYADLGRLHSSRRPVAQWRARFFAAKTLAGLSHLP